MHTRTQEKGVVTPQESDPGFLRSVQESPVGTAGLGAQSVAVHARDLLREVNIVFITSTIV